LVRVKLAMLFSILESRLQFIDERVDAIDAINQD